MMFLDIADDERMAVERLLRTEVADLSVEIRHTDDSQFKEQLRDKRRMLTNILRRIQEQPQTV